MCLGLPKPTDVQYDISRYLQHGPRRRVIMAFRGVGKSFLTAAYVCWLLYRNPDHKIMVVSASKERADAFSIFTKNLIALVPELAHLKPDPNRRTSNVAFDVLPSKPDQSPSVKSVGITGQLTGSRADTIIADDIEVPKNSQTVIQREKLAEMVKELDAVLKPGGSVIYLGTPQTEESLYLKLPARGYGVRIWPARYPADRKKREQYRDWLAPLIASRLDANPKAAWKPTDPVRFDEQDLMEREASYGRSGFALQFQLDTSLSDAERYPLKLSDMIVLDVDREVAPVRVVWANGPDQVLPDVDSPGFTGDRFYRPMYISKEMVEFGGTVMSIDPSGRGADATGYAVTKFLNGMIYLRRAGGLPGGYDEATLTTLAHIARAEKAKLIRIESNFGDGMFTKLFEPILRRIYPCAVEEYKATGATGHKEKRICDVMEPVLNQHRLVVDRSLILADAQVEQTYHRLFYQLTRITRERGALKHDDVLDAVADAVGYWVEQIGRDVTRAEEDHAARLQEEEYRKFMDGLFGDGTVADPNYLDNY